MVVSTEQRVLDILQHVTDTDEVQSDPDLDLLGLGILDSLGTVQLMVALSESFGIQISLAEFDRAEWATPRKVVAYIESRVGP